MESFDDIPTLPPSDALAASFALKSWTISCGVHLAAFGAVTVGGLYTPAQIGSRGGPMSIQAISSPASAGDLDGEFLSPVAMDAEVNDAVELQPEVVELPLEQVEVELPPVDLTPEDIQNTAAVAANDEPEGHNEPQPDEHESNEPLLEKTANSDALESHDKDAEQSKTAVAPARPREHSRAQFDSIGSLPSAGSIGHNGNEGKTSPTFAQNAPIPYPPDAVRDRLEGRVVLRLHINADGRIVSADLVKSSGHAVLDDAASRGVLHWRAEPARLFGRPVSTTALLPVVFTLR